MSRYDDYDEPSIGHTAKARLFVVGFIVLGIFFLGKMSKGSRGAQDGPTIATSSNEAGVAHADGVPSQFAGNQHTTNPGHIVLQTMLDTYKQLPAFREQSRLQIEIDRPGQGSIRESIDLRLSYEAPNRLRYVVVRPKNEVTVACDGNQLQARIANPATGDFDGQVCLLYTSPSPRDATLSRMPSSA